MQKRIAIYGDSWACGEWSGDAVKTKTHENNYTNYMAKYLSDKGHDVSTFGLPGGSNFSSYRRIIAPITSINNFDIGIVIVTEPFRDFPDCVKYNKNKNDRTKKSQFSSSSTGNTNYKRTSNARIKELIANNQCQNQIEFLNTGSASGIKGDQSVLYLDPNIPYYEKI